MFFLFRYTLYFLGLYFVIMLACFGLHAYLPQPPRILGFVARSMSAYLTLIVCATYGTIASAILKVMGLQFAYAQWTTGKAFKYVGMYSVGIRFNVLDNGQAIINTNRPVVFIVNHQTELDVLLLAAIWPTHCSVTAKKSLRNIPFLGWFMVLSGAIFIDRVDRSQALKAFEGAAKAMRENGQSVMIFPEGTRSYSAEPMLLPFKKGAFHLAVQAGVPIVPIVAENYSHILNLKAKRFNSGTIRVKVLDPIPTKGLTAADVDTLTRDTREKMLNTITELNKDLASSSKESKKDS